VACSAHGANRPEEPDARRHPRRRQHAEWTRKDILDGARREFADRGLSGARVDHIAVRTQTAKRMIYYYFGSKEQLFEAVLEQAYSEIRAAEQDVRLDHLDPLAAIPPEPRTGGQL